MDRKRPAELSDIPVAAKVAKPAVQQVGLLHTTTIQETLDILECVICLDTPRKRPIFSCTFAHITCLSCLTLLSKNPCPKCTVDCLACSTNSTELLCICKSCPGSCPLCHTHTLKPDLLVGKLADSLLKNYTTTCKNASNGCQKTRLINDIWKHEDSCQYRDIKCIANITHSCPWQGSLAKLLAHVKGSSCIQIIRNDSNDIPFQSFIGDVSPGKGTSVFDRTYDTWWKPILLVSRKFIKYLVFLTVLRSSQGLWFMYVYSYCPVYVRNKIIVDILLHQSDNYPGKFSYTYRGSPLSTTLTQSEAHRTGKFLVLTDNQVKALQTQQNIFEYRATIKECPLQN